MYLLYMITAAGYANVIGQYKALFGFQTIPLMTNEEFKNFYFEKNLAEKWSEVFSVHRRISLFS
jgi:hypothetical protein